MHTIVVQGQGYLEKHKYKCSSINLGSRGVKLVFMFVVFAFQMKELFCLSLYLRMAKTFQTRKTRKNQKFTNYREFIKVCDRLQI